MLHRPKLGFHLNARPEGAKKHAGRGAGTRAAGGPSTRPRAANTKMAEQTRVPAVSVTNSLHRLESAREIQRERARSVVHTAGLAQAGNRMEWVDLGGGPAQPRLTWLAKGRPSPRRAGTAWLAFTISSRVPSIGQATNAATSTLTPPSPPWRATLASVWVSKGREGHRLLRAHFASFLRGHEPQARLLALSHRDIKRRPPPAPGDLGLASPPPGLAAKPTLRTVPANPSCSPPREGQPLEGRAFTFPRAHPQHLAPLDTPQGSRACQGNRRILPSRFIKHPITIK